MYKPLLATLAFVCLVILPKDLYAQDNALLFEGSNDHVEVFAGPQFNTSTFMTFEAWVNPNSIGSVQPIVSWTDGGSQQVDFFINDSGFLEIFRTDGGGYLPLIGSTDLTAGVWSHVAFVVVANNVLVYVNGVEEFIGSFEATIDAADQFRLGTTSSFSAFYDGLMDEARFWHEVLDEATIQSRMRTSVDPASFPELQSYYKFNETGGTTLPDIANGFDGALVDFPDPSDPNWVPSPVLTETISVLSNADSGPGTLREAISLGNASLADNVSIEFNLPGGGPWNINLSSGTPFTVTRSMTIDGITQPLSIFGDPNSMIIIDGGAASHGFELNAAGIEIYGLVLNNFVNAIDIAFNGDNAIIGAPGKGNVLSGNSVGVSSNGDNLVIQGNYIGTTIDGLSPNGNTFRGIDIEGGSGITIGGNRLDGEGNVISATGSTSSHHGLILRANANDIQVFGNLIGTDANGENDLGNYSRGVSVEQCFNVQIGGIGTGEGNVISGNGTLAFSPGVEVGTSSGADVVIRNNIIGLTWPVTHQFLTAHMGSDRSLLAVVLKLQETLFQVMEMPESNCKQPVPVKC